MLRLIVTFAPQFSPTAVNLDYEEAAINAFKAVFPAIQVKGCYFHLMQNFRKKLGKRHLQEVFAHFLKFKYPSIF